MSKFGKFVKIFINSILVIGTMYYLSQIEKHLNKMQSFFVDESQLSIEEQERQENNERLIKKVSSEQ